MIPQAGWDAWEGKSSLGSMLARLVGGGLLGIADTQRKERRFDLERQDRLAEQGRLADQFRQSLSQSDRHFREEMAFKREKEASDAEAGWDLDPATGKYVPGGTRTIPLPRGGVPEVMKMGKAALDEKDERDFQSWYALHARTLGLNPNPDDPEHHYDYRAAYRAKVNPDASGHWPSEFKDDGHPNLVVDGVNTKTGVRVFGGRPAHVTDKQFGRILQQDSAAASRANMDEDNRRSAEAARAREDEKAASRRVLIREFGMTEQEADEAAKANPNLLDRIFARRRAAQDKTEADFERRQGMAQTIGGLYAEASRDPDIAEALGIDPKNPGEPLTGPDGNLLPADALAFKAHALDNRIRAARANKWAEERAALARIAARDTMMLRENKIDEREFRRRRDRIRDRLEGQLVDLDTEELRAQKGLISPFSNAPDLAAATAKHAAILKGLRERTTADLEALSAGDMAASRGTMPDTFASVDEARAWLAAHTKGLSDEDRAIIEDEAAGRVRGGR